MGKATNRFIFKAGGIALILVVAVSGFFYFSSLNKGPAGEHSENLQSVQEKLKRVRSSFSPKNPDDAVSRVEFEINRLKDPQTGKVPDNIRQKELAFASKIPSRESLGNPEFTANWDARGPFNVGGRTRALAIDLNYNGSSNQRILAGGISGGVYLSTNNGSSWSLTTALDAHSSVTCIAQDPNNRNVWYYGTGEYLGNSAAGNGNFAYWGHGIFKSTNNGDSWTQLASTINNNDPNAFDDFFDIIWNVAVSPTNSDVYVATYGGIFQSTDGGNSWGFVLGRNQSPYSSSTDVVAASNGDIYAAMGRNGTGISEYGVYRSTNNGSSWSNITPNSLNNDPARIVLASAPSDANTLYALVQNGNGAQASDHQLFRYNAGSNNWTDLSSSIPDFNDPFGGVGKFNSQGGYDLLVKVKPNDPNTIWLGGTNLIRSTDGGSNYDWVGGYHPSDFGYPVHHPDQHSIAFYPNNANAMISGHDGGLSQTNNVLEPTQTWNSLNNGYMTTQFYAISVDPQGGNLILGGLQDNGSWLASSTSSTASWSEAMTGDGAFNAIVPGGSKVYVSSQLGNIVRGSQSNGQVTLTAAVSPAVNNPQYQFIAPMLLDPNDSRVMYLAEGNRVWRNSNLDGIPDGNPNPTNINWTSLDNSAVANTQVTSIAVTTTPANRLYFAATNYQNTTVMKRVDNAASNPAGTTITPPISAQWAYLNCIAVNPNNGDEIMAVFSNYGVEGVWYSNNAGASWSNVEGNLGGQDSPSMRWAVIHPTSSGNVYMLATSTGIYSTTSMNGGSTSWLHEGASNIGNAITAMLVSRPSDGLVVAGTHGRGVYSATVGGGGGAAVAGTNVSELTISLQPNTVRSEYFNVLNTGGQTLNYNLSVSGFGPNMEGTYRGILLNDGDDPTVGLPRIETEGAGARAVGKAGKEDTRIPFNEATDILGLDDGDNSADDFIGTADYNDFYWANEFNLGSQGFSLSEIQFYMQTESVFSNLVYVGIYSDLNGNPILDATLNLGLASTGGWFNITVDPAIEFNPNSTFYLVIGATGLIAYPAGADTDAQIPNKSFWFDPFYSTWNNLNGVGGFENGAFIIRASGNFLGGGNQPPTAVASVPGSGQVNQSITFDGSGSFDSDGSIAQYFWDFGDGNSSNQSVASHTYTSGNTYNWSLTVTDDQGATDQASGSINISGLPSPLTVSPTSGNIAPGGNALITATYNANGVSQGNYSGSIIIGGNGGTVNLPVTVNVDNAASIDDEGQIVEGFYLAQNYPNPFNPETWISYRLESAETAKLVVYNSLGQIVRTLVDQRQPAGNYLVQWDGKDDLARPLGSGVYFYRLIAGEQSLSRKMLFLK